MSNPYTARELENGLWCIEEGGVRCFLVVGDKRAMLVDTGYGGGDLKSFVDTLTKLPVFIVNTHADRDHVGCNAQFGKAFLHPAEFDYYEAGRKEGDTTELSPLWEGDILDLGTRKFEVVLIPGHTPGSIALLDRENRILIGGDSVQTGAIYMFGRGRNLLAYRSSMIKLEGLSDQFDTVYPSHNELPVPASVLPGLVESAQKLLEGSVEGVDNGRGLPCKLYDCGVGKFLYEPRS